MHKAFMLQYGGQPFYRDNYTRPAVEIMIQVRRMYYFDSKLTELALKL
jgi:hypothetical protein